MTRCSFTFTGEPREMVYERLLEIGLVQAARAGMVLQKWRTYPSSALDVLEQLTAFLIDVKDVDEWPGTRLGPGYVDELRLYDYVRPVKEILASAASGLFDWQNTDLPEDLHLVREDGSVWLGSIAHEEDAWLELSQAEHAEIRETAPDVFALLRRD